MHARGDRGDPRGQEGIGRLPDRGAGERTKLARTPHRHQATWARDRARPGGRRWRARLLEGHRGGGSGRPSIEPEDRRLAGVELTRSLKCRTAAPDPFETSANNASAWLTMVASEF